MYKIEMEWKEFNLDLDAINAKMKADYVNCSGLQAVNVLEIWFTQEPTELEKQDIQDYLDSLTDQSPEALSYRTKDQIAAAMVVLKSDITTKTWNQLTAPQRKVIIGQEVTKQDLIAAGLL